MKIPQAKKIQSFYVKVLKDSSRTLKQLDLFSQLVYRQSRTQSGQAAGSAVQQAGRRSAGACASSSGFLGACANVKDVGSLAVDLALHWQLLTSAGDSDRL